MMHSVTGALAAAVSSMCQSPSDSWSWMRRTHPVSTKTLSSRPARGAHMSVRATLRGAQLVRIPAISAGVAGRAASAVSIFSLQR